jgi:hypothetical protein
MSPLLNECIPYQDDGEQLPCSVLAGKSVVGKRFVKVAGDIQGGTPDALTTDTEGNNYQIEQSAAKDARALGVASHNAAEKKKVTVLASPGMVVPVVAGGAITAGEAVGIGTEGKAVKSDGEHPAVGLAMATAAEGEDVPVRLF